MDALRFDELARALIATAPRRAVLGLGAGSVLGALGLDSADAKRKKGQSRNKNKKKCKKCGPCGKCQKGKCKPKPVGTPCGAGKQCFANGTCACGDVCASGCQSSSLQAAIDDANAGDIIQLCAESYGGTLSIAKSLTLRGAGPESTTLDGQGSGSVVTIAANDTVHLEGLRITGGNAGFGGGIATGGTLTLTECSVTGNVAGGNGGGIINLGSLTLVDSSVTDNVAVSNGGGIYNQGTLTLDGTNTIADNQPNDCVHGSGGSGCP